jgi:hypothetical protein
MQMLHVLHGAGTLVVVVFTLFLACKLLTALVFIPHALLLLPIAFVGIALIVFAAARVCLAFFG